MIGPFGLKSMAGAAFLAGPVAAPDDTGLWGHSGRFKQPDGLQTRRFRHRPVRAGVCLPNPSARIDSAMRWAADLGGSPPEDVCVGNPGEVFTGLGEVPVSAVDTLAADSLPAEVVDVKQAPQYPSLRAPPPGRM